MTDESNSAGTSFGRQVYIAGMRVWSEPVSGTGVFLFQDHLGSVRVTGTSSGTLDDDIDYLPFGYQYANYGSASANHYRFTDDESDDAQSSTEYSVFRNLDPWMGRFNRPDPYDGSYDPYDPQSLNRYAYVRNGPLEADDPFGLMACDQVPWWMPQWMSNDNPGCTPAKGGSSMNPDDNPYIYYSVQVRNPNYIPDYPDRYPLYITVWIAVPISYLNTANNPLGGSIAPSNNPQQPQKKPCNSSTRIGGVIKAVDGTVTTLALLNLAGIHYRLAFALVGVTCLTPEPGEPLACAAGIAGGASLAAGGTASGYGAYLVAKDELFPGIKQAITCAE